MGVRDIGGATGSRYDAVMACSFHMGSGACSGGKGVSGQWLVRPRRPFFGNGVQSWRVRKTSIGFSGFFRRESGSTVGTLGRDLRYLGLAKFR